MLLEQIFTNLQSRWQKAWWLRFFTKSTALGRLLDLKEKPNSFELVQTYLSSSWWNRLWFRSFLAWEELCRFYDIMNVAIFLKNENLLNKDNLNTLEVRISDQELISSRFDRGLVYLGYSGYLDRFKYEGRFFEDYYVRFDNFSLGSLVPGLKSLKFAHILNQENFEAITKKKINTKCHVGALVILYRSGILTPDNLEVFTALNSPLDLATALRSLNSADILTPENRKVVTAQNSPLHLPELLRGLKYADILTPENREFVAGHSRPLGLAHALSILNSAGILTTKYREFVAGHSQPLGLAEALSILNSAGILTPENSDFVAGHRYPKDLAHGSRILNSAGILTPKNRQFIATHVLPARLAEALSILQRSGILTPDNHELIVTHGQFVRLAEALSILQRSGILTSDNRELIVTHGQPDVLARALSILNSAGILTPENREIVTAHGQPDVLAHALSILNSAGILTPENLRQLASTDSRKLLTQDAWEIVWHRIPFHYLTQANINRLFEAARYHNGDAPYNNRDVNARLRRAVDIIFEQHIPPARVAVHVTPAIVNFNNGQSTHTASVHQTVSQSATKLLIAYGSHLALETTIANIKRYLQGLDNSSKNAAAKRCIERITAIDYTFIDRTSGVSIRQLLALAWLAIHDRKKCTATCEDGLAFLIDGLYEIQRGYNLNEHGVDDGRQDGPICHAGTFNKLIEKLNGIHQDVAVYYITHEGALSKFPKLVQSHAKAYLSRLAEPKDAILRAIENAGNIAPIWEEIKDSVINELWDEFKAAYGNNRSHPQFTSIIECWTDVEVDIAEFNAQIKVPELAQVSLFNPPKEDGAQVENSAQALSLGYERL